MSSAAQCRAVIFNNPGELELRTLELQTPGAGDLVVEITHSGISTGTEKLLWNGTMPAFPGLGYPLVPGYEAVGVVLQAGRECQHATGERVFVPGSQCFGDQARGLFGASASRLVVPDSRVVSLGATSSEQGVLIALAATAMHLLSHSAGDSQEPEALVRHAPQLIVGHGVLGRLTARLCLALGASAPMVWENNAARRAGAFDYPVASADDDSRPDYLRILDVSGCTGDWLDTLIARGARGVDIMLGGFYNEPLHFTFPPAFMREASIRIAAQWQPADLLHVMTLLDSKALDLSDLITHRFAANDAHLAYPCAFEDPECLKSVLDWSAA